MTTSVEEFIIQLGFDDKEALAGYKSFIKQLDNLNKKVVSSINSTRSSIRSAKLEQQKADLATNKILEQQLLLRDKIIQGKQIGLDTSKEEATLARAKKYATLRDKTLSIEERISKELYKQSVSLKNNNSKVSTSVSFSPEQVQKELRKVKKLLKDDFKQNPTPLDLIFNLPSVSSLRKDIKTLSDKISNSNVDLGATIAKGKRTALRDEVKALVERLSKHNIKLGVKLDQTSYRELQTKLKDLDSKTDLLNVEKDLKQLEVLRLKLEGLRDMAKKPVSPLGKTSPESSTNTKGNEEVSLERLRNTFRDSITRAVTLDLDVGKYQKQVEKLTDPDKIKESTVAVKRLVSEYKNLNEVNKHQGRMDAPDPNWEAMKQAHLEEIVRDRKRHEAEIKAIEDKKAKEEAKRLKKQARDDKKAKKDALARQRDYQKKLNTIETSSSFRKFARNNPERAAQFSGQMKEVVRQAGTVGMSPKQVVDLDRQFKELNATFRDMNTSVTRTQRAMLGLHTVQLGLRDSTRHLIRSYASVFAMFAGTTAINRVGQDFEAMRSAMLAATGTQEGVETQMRYLDELTGRLGLSMRDTSDAFTKFLFAADGKLSTNQTQDLFTSLTELGTVLGISKERMKLSMNAITQIDLSLLPH